LNAGEDVPGLLEVSALIAVQNGREEPQDEAQIKERLLEKRTW
jgi:hypothetical protein